jgi:hypothetical protein
MSALDIALSFIARGWTPVVVEAGTKKPIGMAWQERRITEETAPRYFNGDNQNVGVQMGPASGGLTDVDLDCAESIIIAPYTLPMTRAIFGRASKRNSHRLYITDLAASRDDAWVPFNDPTSGEMLLELRIGGGDKGCQTVFPGSVHESGEPVAWETEGPPADVQGAELDEKVRLTAALTLLARYWPDEGKRHNTARVVGGFLSRAGKHPSIVKIMGEAVARAANDPEWKDRRKAFEDAAIAHRAGKNTFGLNGLIEAFGAEVAIKVAEWVNYGDEPIPAPTATVITLKPTVDPDPAPPPKPEPFNELEKFTNVPGLIGSIVDWVVATARRPNRVLALGTGITVIGTLIGRRVASPTRSGTHLYVVPIGRSGAGKQHILSSAMRLMRAANAEAHVGPSRFHSGSAIFQRLKIMPVMICLQDEIGGVLRAMTDRQAGTHERQIGELMRSLWGLSFDTLAAPAWATQNDGINLISCTGVSILGVSTPYEFNGALQGESVDNGLLNRFLVLMSDAMAPDTDPRLDPYIVPAQIVEALQALYTWSGPESLLSIGDPVARYNPDILPWTNEQASTCYVEFTRMVDDYTGARMDMAPYLARCAETAVRLATIRAAGRWGYGASVDLSDMEWWRDVAWTAGRALADMIQIHVTENERSKDIARMGNWIRQKYGKFARPITKREVQIYMGSHVKSSDFRDRFEHLIVAGIIKPEGNGFVPC